MRLQFSSEGQSRLVRAVLGPTAAVLMALCSLPAGGAVRLGTPCGFLALAPASGSSMPLMCADVLRDVHTSLPVGLEVSTSKNGGHTWVTHASTGVVLGPTTLVSQLLASADFAHDKTWYLQTFDSGVYSSSDDGATWLQADRLATQPSTYRSLSAVVTSVGGIGSRSSLLYANAGTAGSALVVPPLHVPVSASPGYTLQLLASPPGSGPNAGKVFALTQTSTGDGTIQVNACNAVLACATLLWQSPGDFSWDPTLELAPDFAASGRMALWGADNASVRPRLYLSWDGGQHLQAVTGIQMVLDQVLQEPDPNKRQYALAVAFVPHKPDLLYVQLRMSTGRTPEQIWRSADRGRTWNRVAYAYLGRSGMTGNIPFIRVLGDHAFADEANLQVDDQGSLLAFGWQPKDDYKGFWCSHDGGRSWKKSC